MLAFLLVTGVVVGIVYPFVWGKSGLLARRASEEATAALATARAEAALQQAKRGELCPHCSTLNPVGRKLCVECAGPMPVDNLSRLMEGANKEELMREGIQSGLLLLAMVLAMVLANGLPMWGKLFILVGTVAALSYRFLKTLSD